MKKLLTIIAALASSSLAFGQATVTRGGAGGLTVQQASLVFTTPVIGVASGTSLTLSGLIASATSTASTSYTSPIFASNNADPADAGVIRLGNGELIAWEASPAGTDVTLTVNSGEQFVFSAAILSPTFITPALGTPASGVATNLTGTAAGLTAGTASAVAVGGITGLGANVGTALAVAVGSAGGPVVNGGVLGTPSSGTMTNVSGFPKADVLEASLFAADAGANDTYVITLAPAITAYVTGAFYFFKANTANTGAATININGVGAKTIVKVQGGITTTLANNDILAGQWVLLVYDGTNMQMQSMLGNAPSGSGTISSGTTNSLPKYTAATTVGDSLFTDNGTTGAYTGSGGFTASGPVTAGGTGAGAMVLPEGTAQSLVANSFIIQAPADVAAGGLSYITPAAAATGIMRVANSSGNMTISHSELSGDATTSGSNALTLATVNGNVGTFGSATAAPAVTVNAKGLVTAASNVTVTPAVGSITGLGTGVGASLAIANNSAGGYSPIDGAATLSNKTLTAPKFATGGFVADANGNELIIFTTTASAVNEWTLANGATGVNPKLTASGETNVGLDFQVKGTGTYRLLATASGPTDLRLFEDTDNGTNYASIIAPASMASDVVHTLPAATGTLLSTGAAVTVAQGGTGIASGTSGGIPYFSGTTTIASSAALAANALVIGGGAGTTPATTTTGTGILTFIGTPSSANLAAAINDETGTGLSVFSINAQTARTTSPGGADDTYSGETITGLNNSGGVTQWDAVYMNSSSQWVLADANGSSTYPARGIAVATVSTGNATTVLTRGIIRNDAWTWTPGGTIYLSTTAGQWTQTAPSTTGDKVQVLGWAIDADTMMVAIGTDYGTAP